MTDFEICPVGTTARLQELERMTTTQQSERAPRFTMVFEGNLREFKGNPMKAVTDWGTPEAVGVGDAFAENDALLARIRRLEEALRDVVTKAPGSGPLWYGSEEIKAARAALTE